MSILEMVQTRPKDPPLKVLLYGPEGVGKSSFAAEFPDPIFIQTEDGLLHLDAPRLPLVKTWEGYCEQINALYNDAHGYKTLVVDSADWLERIMIRHLCETHDKETLKSFGWQVGDRLLANLWDTKVLNGLDLLRHEKGMNIVLLAHAGSQKVDDPRYEKYQRICPNLEEFSLGVVTGWADFVFHYAFELVMEARIEGAGKGQKKTYKAHGGTERVLYTQNQASFIAKHRGSMPAEIQIPADPKQAFDEVFQHIHKETVTSE